MYEAIRALGVWAILIFAALDAVGLPASGDVAVVLGAASRDEPLLAIVALGFAGAVIGDHVVYWVGRFGGRLLPARLVSAERRRRVSEGLDRRAPLVLVGGRLVTAIRSEVALLAGLARLPYRRFTLWNGVGCLVWALVAALAGRLLGDIVDVPALLRRAERWSGVATAAVLVAVAAYVAWHVWARRNPQRSRGARG
jgi:membrane-associated protein